MLVARASTSSSRTASGVAVLVGVLPAANGLPDHLAADQASRPKATQWSTPVM